jgi:DNA-directed RNA polymerase beta' subunit
MSVYLDRKHRKNKDKATQIARNIIYTLLKDVAEAVYDDPKNEEVVVELNDVLMKNREISMKELVETIDLPDCSIKRRGTTLRVKPKKAEGRKKLLSKIISYPIRGVPGIGRVLVTEEKGEWVIRTDGSNLPRVLEIAGIDPARTVTNHVHEIAQTLGIEAARSSLVREALGVLEEQGLDVDVRHIMLVSDIMTTTGAVKQIGRHGISGAKSSVLARAAFEITVPNIIAAAIKGEADPLKGVTENVIVGQSIPIGTGLVNLYMSTLASKREKSNG